MTSLTPSGPAAASAALRVLPRSALQRAHRQSRRSLPLTIPSATGLATCPLSTSSAASALTLAVALPSYALRRRALGERSAGRPDARAGSSRLGALAASTSESQDLAAEIAGLEREAARVRARARDLEAEREAEQRAERQRLFTKFDVDGSGGINAAELRRGMTEYLGIDVDEDGSSFILAKFGKSGSGELALDEFDVKLFQTALERKRLEDRAKKEDEQARQSRMQEAEDSLDTSTDQEDILDGSQDDSIVVRLGSALAYLLPLTDGAKFGLPLCIFFPDVSTLVQPLISLEALVDTVPFGSLILFILVQYLSRQRQVPSLMRYNFAQAIDLDLRICLLSIFLQLAPLAIGAFVPFTEETIAEGIISDSFTPAALVLAGLGVILATLVFLPFFACIMYCIICSMFGFAPRGIPVVSQEAERAMRLSRHSGDA